MECKQCGGGRDCGLLGIMRHAVSINMLLLYHEQYIRLVNALRFKDFVIYVIDNI